MCYQSFHENLAEYESLKAVLCSNHQPFVLLYIGNTNCDRKKMMVMTSLMPEKKTQSKMTWDNIFFNY